MQSYQPTVMKKVLIATIISLFVTDISSAQESQYDKDVKRFLEINGSKQNMEPIVTQMMAQFKMMKTGVPDEFWSRAEKNMIADLDNRLLKVVPIYKSQFSHEEIKGLIAFYESPLGKSFIEKSVKLLPQTMQIGQQWGMEIGTKIQQDLMNEGY